MTTINEDIFVHVVQLPYLKLLQASAGVARMIQNVDKTDKAHEYAEWVNRNVKSLMTMLNTEEQTQFLDELNKYIQEKRDKKVAALPKYKVVGRKLVKR